MTPYYAKQLERGLVFQDFVAEMLWGVGIATCSYSSRLFQQRIGENKAQIEIKFDDRRASTGNLYIETAEKSHPDNPSFVTSGIYRPCIEYVIGDYDVIYRFPINVLRALHERGEFREVSIPTSRGFLIPEARAEKLAMQILRPSLQGDIAQIIARQGRLDREQAAALGRALRDPDPTPDLFDDR